jgi:DNA transposition AAA+ family ATPase
MSTKSNGGLDLTTAPLANVSLCEIALTKALSRPRHLPGMVCFYGPSGWGKSTAATYVSLVHRAYYIQCQDGWVRKAILVNILRVMGIHPKNSIWEMTEQVCEQLAKSGRPLIIDELDKLVEKQAVELIRDLYEGSGAVILLIGEERLPDKLTRWERFHGRILDWVPAQPADSEDARHLKRLYHPDLEVEDKLLGRIVSASRGSARRVCVNLARVEELAREAGLARVMDKDWGSRTFFTGEAPARRIPDAR